MKLLKNTRFLAGVGLLIAGLIGIAIYLFHTPAREITRAELTQLLESGNLGSPIVVPTPYQGIYHLEATLKGRAKNEKVFITTHLDESQIQKLFAQNSLHVEMPGAGLRGQWVNILSSIIIAGVAIMLVLYQTNIGKGKNSRVLQRPTVTFHDVAGVEEAKSEVQEVVDFLRDPKNISASAGICPKACC